MVRILVGAVLVSLASMAANVVAAQDASPSASPLAEACVAPELPPGTPGPPRSSPVAAVGTAAAPVGTPQPTPRPVGSPADPETVARIVAAEENLNACFNAGDYRAVVALFTPTKLMQTFGTDNAYDALAILEAAGAAGEIPPFEQLATENVEILADGRIRDEITLRVGDEIVHEADYWVERDGYLLVDWSEPLPLGGTPTP